MVTEMDKALVAAIMSIIALAVLWFGYEGYFAQIREEQWLTIVAVLTPVLVYFTPNKRAAQIPQKVADLNR